MKDIIKNILESDEQMEIPEVEQFFLHNNPNTTVVIRHHIKQWYRGEPYIHVHPEQQKVLDFFMLKDKENLLYDAYYIYTAESLVIEPHGWWFAFETSKRRVLRAIYYRWKPVVYYFYDAPGCWCFKKYALQVSEGFPMNPEQIYTVEDYREFLDLFNIELGKSGFDTRY